MGLHPEYVLPLALIGLLLAGLVAVVIYATTGDRQDTLFYEDDSIECWRDGDTNTCYLLGTDDRVCLWSSPSTPGPDDIPPQCRQEELH